MANNTIEKIVKKIVGVGFNKYNMLTTEVNLDGEVKTLIVCGNDECFDENGFFHYGVNPDDVTTIYKMWYDADGIDLDQIDYRKPDECIIGTIEFDDDDEFELLF